MKYLFALVVWGFTLPLYGQFDFSKKLSGLSLKIGLSNSIENNVTQPFPASYISAGAGVYHYFSINKSSKSNLAFHYVRAEATFGARTGLFKTDFNQLVAVRSRFWELGLIVPLSWEVSENLAVNFGIGGNLAYVTGRSVISDLVPTPTIAEGNTFKGGLIFDWHLLFSGNQSNAVVGLRTLVEPARYSYFDVSFYLGFGLPSLARKDN